MEAASKSSCSIRIGTIVIREQLCASPRAQLAQIFFEKVYQVTLLA
jgi:hypothetical protein